MHSSNSVSPESLSLSSSSPIEGLVGFRSGGESRSSSSSRVSVKGVKEERKKSQRAQSSSPFRGGISKPPVGKRASWRKMMEGMYSDAASSQNPNPVTTGEGVGVHQSGAYGGQQLSIQQTGSELSMEHDQPMGSPSIHLHRSETYQDDRQVHHTQTFQQFQDERQVHHHQTVQQYISNPNPDPQLISEAVGAVTGARQEAAAAVMQARSQMMEANVHFNAQVSQLREELSNRNASLGLAAEREKLLNARLEDSLREIEALKSSLLQMTQNGAGSVEHAINV